MFFAFLPPPPAHKREPDPKPDPTTVVILVIVAVLILPFGWAHQMRSKWPPHDRAWSARPATPQAPDPR
jgi:hypothetical protein